jgi:Fur family ferric uptake transcriptional regulator
MHNGALPPIRRTRQRAAVEDALGRETTFRSAQDLHASIRVSGNQISLATVYNQLRQMADRHEVDVVRTEAGEALYRRCGAGEHHHHLRCRRCGRVEELEAPAVETWAVTVADRSGYTEVAHTVEVTGICPSCADG